MTCPRCDTPLTCDASLLPICICPNPDCVRTLMIDGETARLATERDIQPLTPLQMAAVRAARKAARTA